MWDSIWHLRGSVPIEITAPNDEVLGRIEIWADHQRKIIVREDSNHSTFEAPGFALFFGSASWHAMALYDKGNFWIEQDGDNRTLSYELRSWYVFVSCLVISSIILSFGMFDVMQGQLEGLNSIGVVLVIFGFLYGLNVAFSKESISAAIKRMVTQD